MSSWMNGKSTPSLAKAIDIGDLFKITPDRLMGAEFIQLLQRELPIPSDSKRLKRISSWLARSSCPCDGRDASLKLRPGGCRPADRPPKHQSAQSLLRFSEMR
jgi:hypothetical protein